MQAADAPGASPTGRRRGASGHVGLRDGLLEVAVGPSARGWFTTRQVPALAATGPDGGAGHPLGFNLASHVGDDPAAVATNREVLAQVVGCEVAWMNQTHSVEVAVARRGPAPEADALVLDADLSDAPGAVGVLVADCVPVLLATTDASLVAAVHAGRRGMLGGIVERTLAVLTDRGGAAADLWAVIGPSVCGACYEVPAAMRQEAGGIEPACTTVTSQGTPGLDVAAGVRAQLRRAGVTHVEATGWCTYEDPRLYSYRREGATGRLAGVVRPGARPASPSSHLRPRR